MNESRPTPEELEELLGAYALDAVDPDEALAVEQYLRENPRAREEVDRHREVASMLGSAGADAPAGLWDAIADSLGAAESPPAPSGQLGDVLRMPAPRRRSVPVKWAVAVGSVAALVLVVMGIQLGRQQARFDDRLSDLSASIGDESLLRAANVALADPDARTVELATPDGEPMATLVVLPDGQGFMIADELPALSDDQTYQLWAVDGDHVVSAGVLGSSPQTVAFQAAGPADTFAVTVEQAGGVVQTEQTPVLVGSVA